MNDIKRMLEIWKTWEKDAKDIGLDTAVVGAMRDYVDEQKLKISNMPVDRCFILFSKVNQLIEYHGVVLNSKDDAERTAKLLGKSLKRFVDYHEETRILNKKFYI